MDRRCLLKNSLALGGLAGLGGCAAQPHPVAVAKPVSRVAIEDRPPPLAPIRAHPDRLFDIKVCIRPFRTKGPNLDVEQIGDAMVVHNYGHGGSGWSLSWGSADIALAAEAPANFGDVWEQMARMSWKNLRPYLGLAGNPVAFTDMYRLSDTPLGQEAPRDPSIPPLPPPSWSGLPAQSSDFGKYADRISDITPQTQVLADDINPFPAKHVTRTTNLFFNFTEYGHLLTGQFFAAGGKIVMRDFHAPSELANLPEKVVINCPGFAARDWWKDKNMMPVRGQTGWLIPQPEVQYGLTYRNVQVLSKSDGIMVIALENGELKGYNDSDESVRRAESERAVRVIEELYSRFPGNPV